MSLAASVASKVRVMPQYVTKLTPPISMLLVGGTLTEFDTSYQYQKLYFHNTLQ